MNGLFDFLPPQFLPRLLAGMLLNFEIAGLTLLAGLALGLAIALIRMLGGVAGGLAGALVALMRAAPTFVVMFFLLFALRQTLNALGVGDTQSGIVIVALSLLPYGAANVADILRDAIVHWRAGATHAALQALPNLVRVFFVLVMSSSAGAAIGVTEAITVILHDAERLPRLSDRLLLFAIGVGLFGVILQSGLAAVNLGRRWLARHATQVARPPAPRQDATSETAQTLQTVQG
jgi:hypothetical protein